MSVFREVRPRLSFVVMDMACATTAHEDIRCSGCGETATRFSDDGAVFTATMDFELMIVRGDVAVVEAFMGICVLAVAIHPVAAVTWIADDFESEVLRAAGERRTGRDSWARHFFVGLFMRVSDRS